MNKLWLVLGLTTILAGCASKEVLDVPEGSDVTIEKTDGVSVSGRLIEVKPEQVIVEGRDGSRTNVPRAQIASLRATSLPATLHTPGRRRMRRPRRRWLARRYMPPRPMHRAPRTAPPPRPPPPRRPPGRLTTRRARHGRTPAAARRSTAR